MDVPITRRWALFYDYDPENLVERRAPHRPVHIELFRRWRADGRLLMGGAVGEPPHGGLLVVAVDGAAEVEAFVAADPYVEAGIVESWRVESFMVVE